MSRRASALAATLATKLALVLTISAATAHADAGRNLTEAKAHFAVGSSYFKSHLYRRAVDEFLDAYRLSAQPDLLYNIAVCYEGIDDPGRASSYYKRYLDARPHAPERTSIEASLYRMSPRVAKVTVHTVEDAEVLIDNLSCGTAPIEPQLLTAGRHRVEVRKGGARPGLVDVSVRGGSTSIVSLEPGDSLRAVEALPLLPSASEPMASEAGQPRRWLWPVVGVSAGVLAVGAVVLVAVLASGGTDFTQKARSSCTGQGCVLIEALR